MTIRFTCSECASVLKIKDDLAGTSGRCPKCNAKFIVPDLESDHRSTRPVKDSTGVGNSKTRSEGISEFQESMLSPPRVVSHQRDDHEKRSDVIPLGFDPAETLRLDDSNCDLDALGEDRTSDIESSKPTDVPSKELLEVPSKGTPVFAAEAGNEDLDCPSIMVPHPQMATKSLLLTADVQTNTSKKDSYSQFDETPSSKPPSARSIPAPPAFDPSKFLVSDRPAIPVEVTPPPMDMPETRSGFALQMDREEKPYEPPVSRPIHRPDPVAKAERPRPEKIDLATAAKMMKKAIKDNQAAETHQREIDAKGGFDFGQFFREFGLRGLGLIVGGITASFGLYYVADRAFSNSLKLPKMGYVKGVVKLDGKPLSGAMVTFAPSETNLAGSKRERIRSSIGMADENGQYRMMYIPSDGIEGVAVGKCRIWVTHIGPKGRSDVPDEWSEGGMMIKEVSPGNQATPFDINMESRKR